MTLVNAGGTAGLYNVANGTSDDFITFGTPAAESGTQTWAVPFACQFKLAHTINNAEFTQLYDRYKILKARVKMINLSNVSQVQQQSSLPTLVTVTDYDDATVPTVTNLTGVNEMYQRQGVYERRFGGTQILSIRPRVAGTVYNSAVSSGYSSIRAPWIDVNSPSVPHYALKGIIRNLNLSTTVATTAVRIDCELTIAFKDPR